jgi:NAD(P)-dependent dehydrogenase (short-subunit alcohol dehydrogenase family)
MPLNGKTILITGSARRIGRSLAIAVAKAGGDLVIHHNNSPEAAEKTKLEILDLGQKAQVLQADFSDPESISKFIKNAFSQNKIDVLVNNASIFSDLSWSETKIDDWNKHLAINLTAPFLLSQAFGQSVIGGQEGRIINLLDWRALRPGPDHFPYTISKAGLHALTKSLAIALAPNITVNGIALGAVLPPSDSSSSENIISALPIPRWAELIEVEETLLFLLSGPSYITGEIIHLDGGRHLT